MKRRCAPTIVLALLLASRIAVAASTASIEHPSPTTSSVTRSDYLATGELAQIVDAEGHSTTLGYDLRGLRTSLVLRANIVRV